MTAYFKIVHHIAGRIRLRLSPSILQQPIAQDAQQLTQRVKAMQGIQDIRLNLAIGSIVIQYDPATIHPELWDQWLQEYDDTVALPQLLDRWQSQITSHL